MFLFFRSILAKSSGWKLPPFKPGEVLTEGDSWKIAYPILSPLLKERGFKVGAELGVAFGGHAEHILANTDVETLYGVDPYRWLPGYDDAMNDAENLERLCDSTRRRLAQFGSRFVLLRMTSAEAAETITEFLDFIYIDADHSYEGVKADLRHWAPKVRSGGIISGHDYGHPNFPGVKNAVDEFFGPLGLPVDYNRASGVWWIIKS